MRRTLVLLALLLLLVTPASPVVAGPLAQSDQAFAFFPATAHNIPPPLKPFFDANGGLATFGLPLTELIVGVDGLHIQYFERARLEYRPSAALETRVTVTRAGALLAAGRTEPAFRWLSASPDPERDFFPQSGHTLGGAFRWFWQTRGGLSLFGYPISEELKEWDEAAGVERLVQYFERARFEYRPEFAGTPDEVMLSPVGRWLLEQDPLALAAASTPATPITLLAQASTGFSTSSHERVTNLTRATAMVDGIVVPAGAEFSFNAVGDFSPENGFVEGYAIVGGQLERVVGGGLCQVSTTLFRAVSHAGLQITHRVGHSHIVYFYENILGFDATVFSPSVDFRWRNDTAGPVYIVGVVDPVAARVTFQLYGTPDGRSVRYQDTIEKNWKRPGAPVWQLDRSLPKGVVRQLVHGRPGVDVILTRVITMADGASRVEPFVTRYTPWEDFFVYGPGVTPPSGVKVIAPKG